MGFSCPYTSKYLLRRYDWTYLDPPGTHPSPTFSEGTTGALGYVVLLVHGLWVSESVPSAGQNVKSQSVK